MSFIEQKLKEFDEKFPKMPISPQLLAYQEDIKSFLLTVIVEAYKKGKEEGYEKIEKGVKALGFTNPSEAGQFALHADGYNQALRDLSTWLKSIK